MGKIYKKDSEAVNLYQDNLDLLRAYWKNIAINIFEWKGIEEISPTLTSEIIEETLFDKGEALFFNDSNMGYMCLPVAPASTLNVYKKPTRFNAIGLNYTKWYDVDNSVLIKNNPLKKATYDMIDIYLQRMADIELTKDVHRNAHKTPIIIEESADMELSGRNYWKQLRANEPVIYKNKVKNGESVGLNVMNADIPYINDVLEDDYHNYEARVLTILGLDNYVEDKKERVQSAEVESNQEYIISAFRVALEARQKACDAINKMFGLNLSIEYVKGEEIEEDEEVNDNGEVHSGSERDN